MQHSYPNLRSNFSSSNRILICLFVCLFVLCLFIFCLFYTEIDGKIMFREESSNRKMINRHNKHSSLLIVNKWKLPCSYVSSLSVHILFLLRFRALAFLDKL